ncbi:MAG: CDP-glycerol glycerophosphotransferase family protein [Bacteroidales bacterium]|nr:CDP-glycerol glycerophosphotransferase family protein [Bacteroidales bacterium]
MSKKIYSQNTTAKKLLLNFQILIGWTIIIPLSAFFIVKKKGLFVVIGRDGLYVDNTKYFFNYLIENNENAYFISDSPSTVKTLIKEGITNILPYPSWKAFFIMLRAEFVIVDNIKWVFNLKYYFLFFTKKVQLWHGIGFKRIERDNPRIRDSKYRALIYTKGFLLGTFPKYYALISTSKYFEENFYKNAFKYNHILNFGQARNDIFYRNITEKELIGADRHVYNIAKSIREDGGKVILYTPTFRDKGGSVLADGAFDLERLNLFCQANNFYFIIKLHPYSDDFSIDNYDRILYYDKYLDIYPILKQADVLITDYSSIYLDYFLQDRPIVFYIFDYDKYLQEDRPIRSDFFDITAGSKIHKQEDLEIELLKVLNGDDQFVAERQKMRNTAYLYNDGNASKRVMDFLKKH